MGKRFLALLLSMVMLCAVLPLTGFAATEEEKQALIVASAESYTKSQESAEQESFNGYCGRMTSHQLWHMGINPGVLFADGNQQFDMYSAMKKTRNGYYICSYSAEEYTLESALKTICRNGTKDVYNLVVGFEWTNTEAGQQYGHAVVINGILNGEVYFVQNFYTSIGGEEGNVVVCTIEEFAAMFESWTLFEGVIHFAGKTYADACKEYPTDLFVRARFAMDLRSQPCLVGQDNCTTIRSVAAGERLQVTALLKNTYGEWYYRVEDGNRIGYLMAEGTVLARTNTENMTVKNFTATLDQNGLSLTGNLRANEGLVGAVELTITDQDGNLVRRGRQITDDYRVNLSKLNLGFADLTLPEGVYTLSLYGETAAAYVNRSELQYSHKSTLLEQHTLIMGDVELPQEAKTAAEPEVLNGWVWIDDVWYRYAAGQPVQGWVREQGVWYYLKEDGSVTTGRATIEDKTYYFTATGAMCTGWVTTERGLRYMLADGMEATGWQMIAGSRYYFEENGRMQKSGTREYEGVRYRFQADGKAVKVVDRRNKE